MKNLKLSLVFILLSLPSVTSAQWEYLGGPKDVHSIAIVDTHVFAGTNESLFRKNDDSTSWKHLNTEVMDYSGGPIAVIGSRLFIGTSLGIFVTSDYGVTWDSVGTGQPQKYVYHLASDTLGNLWVVTFNGLYLSTDLGQSWTLVNDEHYAGFVYSLDVSDSVIVVGNHFGGGFLSRDKGKTWSHIDLHDSLFLFFPFDKIIIADGLIFSATWKGIIYVPRDSTSWEIFKSGLVNDTGNLIVAGPPGYIIAHSIRGGVFLLSTRGGSLVDIGSGLKDTVYVLTYTMMKDGIIVYAGTNTGVWRRVITLPLVPMLLSPTDGTTSVPLNPILAWQASPGAESYRLQVSSDQTFQTRVVDVGNLTFTSRQITGLLGSTKYYWRVNATNSKSTSSWSTVWSFTTVSPPDIPNLLSPRNTSVNVPVDATFTWNTARGAESYSLKVAVDANFMPPLVFSKSGITDTVQTVSGLPNATKLYWIVNAVNAAGSSAWSTMWSFTTIASPPDIPNLLLPHNKATNVPVNTTLIWNTASGVESYSLQVATSAIFISLSLVFYASGITDTMQVISGLPSGTTLYWKVKALNATGSSAWSSVWSFTTESGTEVGSPPKLPQNIILYQNHPNPFGEKATIRFRLAASDHIALDVFDLFGRCVASLVNNRYEAGEHAVILNATGLSNGVYVYRLTSTGRTSIKLAVVSK